MTAKDKARELRDKMYLKIPSVYDPTGLPHYPIAKEMALIAVDEIIENNLEYLRDAGLHNDVALNIDLSFWQIVKTEIDKL